MNHPTTNARVVYPPTGPEITAKSWLTEAPMRMLMNNLHPEVAENPNELVVYGGVGRAARTWKDFDCIVATLKRMDEDETLLVQSGKPVGVFRTHRDAPRVLIANSNLVPHWATWAHFNELDRKGLAMYGQMTAGSWIYIGSQGIVQGTYETFAEIGRRHYGGDLKGRWILTAGLGGMGGAQPLAAVMAGACCLAVECDPDRIDFRLRTRYVDEKADTLDEALAMIEGWTGSGQAKSVAVPGNAADVFPELVRRGVRPDVVTDQTSAHDPGNGYLPAGWTLAEWREKRESDPAAVEAAARESIRTHVQAMVAFSDRKVPTLDYGNNIRQIAKDAGLDDAFAFPGFVPACIRPLFCRGIGPFRWCALSGDPEDIYRTDEKVKELIPDDPHLHNWLDMARERISFQGLPARICWVGLGQRHRLGLAFNEMVGSGELKAPDRHRTRSSRCRLGRVAEPRDRGDEGRIGCGLRLAVSERPVELRIGGDLGVDPSRGRGRHGLFAARGDGDLLRRHGRCRSTDRAGAVERSGHGGHAPRRCGIRNRD